MAEKASCFVCPRCQHEGARVTDTRSHGSFRERRRTCTACGLRFKTIEILKTIVTNTKLPDEDIILAG